MPANTQLTLRSDTKGIADYAFSYCGNLTGNLVIPDGVTNVGSYAFYGTNLTGITVPRSVITIDKTSFPNNTNCTITCYSDSAAHAAAIENGKVNLNVPDAKKDLTNIFLSILNWILYIFSNLTTIVTLGIGPAFSALDSFFTIVLRILKLLS